MESFMKSLKIFVLALLTYSLGLQSALAHQKGAPFSGAMGEPFLVHHAHIEDEQILNFNYFVGFRAEDEKRSAISNSLELAIDWTGEFRLGSEIIIPFSNEGKTRGEYGLGDIELQLIKYAFLNQPERILTGVFEIGLPTGNENLGLGDNQTALGALLFFDQAYRNWYLGFNAEFVSTVSGPSSKEIELGLAISYSFIHETGDGVAPSRPSQFMVPSISVELLSESILSGEEKGENIVTFLSGLQLWHPDSGWQIRMGVQFPVSPDREYDYNVHFKIGNHFSWGRIFN